MRLGVDTRTLGHAAAVLVAGLFMLLLPAVGLVHMGISTDLAGNLFWTEPEWIGAVVVFLLVLSIRAVLSSRGTWLGIFSVVILAGLSYLSVPFLLIWVRDGLEAALFAVTLLFGFGPAWLALAVALAHAMWTRHMYRHAQIPEESLLRTRYGR